MNRKTRLFCFELIRNNEVLPEASESLKQRIMLAANRARNQQRFNKQVVVTLCSFAFLLMVISSSLNVSLFQKIRTAQSFMTHTVLTPASLSQASLTQENSSTSQVVLSKPEFDWNSFDNETAILDAFLIHKNWQSSIFKKSVTNL